MSSEAWTLGLGPWGLDLGAWTLGLGPWGLDLGPSPNPSPWSGRWPNNGEGGFYSGPPPRRSASAELWGGVGGGATAEFTRAPLPVARRQPSYGEGLGEGPPLDLLGPPSPSLGVSRAMGRGWGRGHPWIYSGPLPVARRQPSYGEGLGEGRLKPQAGNELNSQAKENVMSQPSTRRRFMGTAAACGIGLGLGDLNGLTNLPRVAAEDTKLDATLVRDGSGVEPLVKLLEQTSRDELLEAVAAKVRGGTSYREVLAALLLAGVRNVQPRPAVGFKFHAVLVVNSAHLASLASPDSDRWLPIFWALDYFKAKQIEEERVSGWKLPPVEEGALPSALAAKSAFIEAMENWDEQAADRAVVSMVRSAGANELFELFCRYGARDYRSIGHKAIYVANSWRTLQCIGWHHAEPVLRSLCFALLNHRGEPNPAKSDLVADRPWRRNLELHTTIREDWLEGNSDNQATRDLLETLRTGSPNEASSGAIESLNRGVSPRSIWDAVFVGSGELLMRQPGIIGLHTLTTANALYYAYQTSGDDATRRMLLLQACSFLPMFRESARGRGPLNDTTIDDLERVEQKSATSAEVIDDIFVDVSQDRDRAAGKIRGFLHAGGEAGQILDAARRLIFRKGNDAHDYKFSSAVLEDYHHVSRDWQDMFLSLSVYNLRGSGRSR